MLAWYAILTLYALFSNSPPLSALPSISPAAVGKRGKGKETWNYALFCHFPSCTAPHEEKLFIFSIFWISGRHATFVSNNFVSNLISVVVRAVSILLFLRYLDNKPFPRPFLARDLSRSKWAISCSFFSFVRSMIRQIVSRRLRQEKKILLLGSPSLSDYLFSLEPSGEGGAMFRKERKQTDRFYFWTEKEYATGSLQLFTKKTQLKNCTVYSGKVGATDQLH